MTLITAVESYVSIKRSMGAVFTTDARILRSFGRALEDVSLEAISPEMCQTFCRGGSNAPPTRNYERKHQSLRGFFKYLVSRGFLTTSPLREPPPRIVRSFKPYIYSHDELRSLLGATISLPTCRTPLQPLTFRTLLLILYGAGLRPSEGIRLRCCDVDLRNQILSIWNTKFFKSRLVPIGKRLTEAIKRYHKERESLPFPARDRSAFFATRTGQSISLHTLERVFAQLRERAGVRRPASDRFQPRIHDLRHTFAVHRLISWYRQGVDVQARLPFLATYLGHVNLAGTQSYLTMTSELLTEASQRFERYAFMNKEDYHA